MRNLKSVNNKSSLHWIWLEWQLTRGMILSYFENSLCGAVWRGVGAKQPQLLRSVSTKPTGGSCTLEVVLNIWALSPTKNDWRQLLLSGFNCDPTPISDDGFTWPFGRGISSRWRWPWVTSVPILELIRVPLGTQAITLEWNVVLSKLHSGCQFSSPCDDTKDNQRIHDLSYLHLWLGWWNDSGWDRQGTWHRNAYRVLVMKNKGKKIFSRPMHKLEKNIKLFVTSGTYMSR